MVVGRFTDCACWFWMLSLLFFVYVSSQVVDISYAVAASLA